ncbi:MAG: carbohydrate-binding domain-containing protein [Bacteroidaceae bacterium]|nr:carbohydrate-binding domain-containing protein [Bacteroidaceae bacterium]
MKKTLSALMVLASIGAQAQVLYVNNSNNTYEAINTATTKQITFDEVQQLVAVEGTDGTTSQYATAHVDSISPCDNGGTALTYSNDRTIVLNPDDATNFTEVVETIETDELVEEWGDFVENFSTTKIITINFKETGVTCNSNVSDVTYTITNNTHIEINSSRSKVGYIVRGSCSNGSLKIYSTKKFQIMANNLTLTNPTGPAINIQSGKTVYFTLSGTSTLCDGQTYATAPNAPDGTPEDQKGTLFSEGQLIFNGTGTLDVTSLGGHGICSDDYIRIRSGNITVTALKDGFNTNDKFQMGRTANASPVVKVKAEGNGIDCGKGNIIIEAGKLGINANGEALKAEYEGTDTQITANTFIYGGYITARTNDDKSSIFKTSGDFAISGGNVHGEAKGNGSKIINSKGGITIDGGKITGIVDGTLSSDTTTAGGFKCDGDLLINNGTIAINCKGEGSKGINCNGSMTINDGSITLLATAANFVAAEYDRKTRAITGNDITINGGTVFAKSYDHAINGTAITVNDGTVHAFSTGATALSTTATQKAGWLLTQDAQ